LIILGVTMPVMDGRTFLEHKAKGEHAEILDAELHLMRAGRVRRFSRGLRVGCKDPLSNHGSIPMKTKVLFLLPLLLVACGGRSETIGGATGICSYTYSGTLTGTFSSDCIGGIAAYDSTHNLAAVTLAGVSTDPYVVSGGLQIVSSGGISNKAYSLTDASTQGAIIVNDSGKEWIANTASGSTPAAGSFSLNVTSNASYATSNGVTGYYIHGTADATLAAVAGSGATGTVTLHSVF
jgi:hypothetical protein